jgi:hypothetical protein
LQQYNHLTHLIRSKSLPWTAHSMAACAGLRNSCFRVFPKPAYLTVGLLYIAAI